MKYIDVSQAAKKWGLSDRRIRYLCNEGRIDGAIKMGWSWTIPEDTPRPRDGRVLRHFKNMDIRPGGVDVDRLLEMQIMHPVSDALKKDKRMNAIITTNLLYLFDKEKIIIGNINLSEDSAYFEEFEGAKNAPSLPENMKDLLRGIETERKTKYEESDSSYKALEKQVAEIEQKIREAHKASLKKTQDD